MPVGCFAVVMATGIVSVAAHQHRLGALSTVLFAVAVGAYVVLAVWPRSSVATAYIPSGNTVAHQPSW